MRSAGAERGVRRQLVALGLAWWAGSCGASEPTSRADPRPPVVLFALDGLEWRVLLPLFAEGRLPTLRALAENGVAGRLETLEPTRSPRIWTSIATGRPPEEHGILDFVHDGTGEPVRDSDPEAVPYTSLDRRVKAFWNVLSDQGIRSATLGWWASWPVEPVDGFLLAQTNTKSGPDGPAAWDVDGGRGLVHPPAREAAVLARFRELDADIDARMERVFGRLPDELPARAFGRLKSSSWALRADLTYLSTARELLASDEPYRLVALYQGGTDVVGHRFWAAHAPAAFGLSARSEEVRVFGHMVRAYYEFVDTELGKLLELVPANANVLVVSDHGMGRDRTWRRGDVVPRLSGRHAWGEPGVLFASGPAFRRARPPFDAVVAGDVPVVAHVYDVCPLLLWLCGVPVGDDLARPVPVDLVDPDFLGAHPVRTVASHEDPAWLEARRRRARSFDVGAESAERLEQLRALGYFDDVR